MDPNPSSEKSGRHPGSVVGTGAQGPRTLPGSAWLIQVSEAGKVKPGVQGPTEDWLPETSPRGPSAPGIAVYRWGAAGAGLSRSPSRGADGGWPCPSPFLPATSLAPRQAHSWNSSSGRKVWFSQKDTCVPSTLPEGGTIEPARSGASSQGRATVITLQPPSRRALGPQTPCGSPSPRAGWWAHKTKPI